jgi:hypothetical protein
MEKISWTDRVRNEEVLQETKEEQISDVHTIIREKVNWIGHILHRNYILKHVIEGNVEGTGRRERRRKHLLNDLKERERERSKRILELERGNTRSHSVENSIWICLKTDYGMSET